jgi:hypothetical protein
LEKYLKSSSFATTDFEHSSKTWDLESPIEKNEHKFGEELLNPGSHNFIMFRPDLCKAPLPTSNNC